MKLENKRRMFYDLATLIDAGIAPAEALKKLGQFDRQWLAVHSEVARRQPLSRAMHKHGLISRFESELLALSEHSGRLPQALKTVSDQVERRTQRVNRVKGKLVPPFLVLFIAIIVGAILRSLGEASSPATIITLAFFQFAAVILALKLTLRLLSKDAGDILSLAYACKGFSWYQLLFQHTIFTAFQWQQASGIDVQESFRRLASLLKNQSLQKQLMTISAQAGRGAPLAQSLQQSSLPLRHEFKQNLLVAEASGTLASSLEQHLRYDAARLDLVVDHFMEWLPRAFYALAVVVAITTIRS